MPPRPCFGVAALVVGLLVSAITLTPGTLVAAQDLQLERYDLPATPILEADWEDPVVTFDLDPDTLAEIPEFDFATLHDSTVFAAEVDWVPVINDPLPAAAERHVRSLQAVATINEIIDGHSSELRQLRPQIAFLNEQVAAENREINRLNAEIGLIKEAITQFAVDTFIGEEELETALSAPQTRLSETQVVVDQVRDGQFVDIHAREDEVVRRETQLTGLRAERRETRRRVRAVQATRLTRLGHARDAEVIRAGTEQAYKVILHERLVEEIEGADFQLVALNAYVIAERTLAEERPECGVTWWMLAGIGRIESWHGQINGDQLDINGTAEADIRGPALDGRILEGAELIGEGEEAPAATGKTEVLVVGGEEGAEAVEGEEGLEVPVIKRLALILDSDGGRLDGDQTYDRAVGPMQFIPQTWRQHEADINGDGSSNPQNLYDAAVASARYLCIAAGSMNTPEGQERGYFAYNHDTEYTENVMESAERYRTSITLPDLDQGDAPELGIYATPNPWLDEIKRVVAELEELTLPNW